ncbi:hypothetical protein RI367_000730 [Sorochytrium milnesiophthora]
MVHRSDQGDSAKDLRAAITANVRGIFDALRSDLERMETVIKRTTIESFDQDEQDFFKKQDAMERAHLKARQELEVLRKNKYYETVARSTMLGLKAKEAHCDLVFTAKKEDTLVVQQDLAQNVDQTVKKMLDDHRATFNQRLEHTELRHTKERKQLSAAQDRKIQDRRTLMELETAHMSTELKQQAVKDMQFKANHQKVLDKKVAEHLRDIQGLEIRQMKEQFELEMRSMEKIHETQAQGNAAYKSLMVQQVTEKQVIKRAVTETKFAVEKHELQVQHAHDLHQLRQEHAEQLEKLVQAQAERSRQRKAKWAVVLQETVSSVDLNDTEMGALATSVHGSMHDVSLVRAGSGAQLFSNPDMGAASLPTTEPTGERTAAKDELTAAVSSLESAGLASILPGAAKVPPRQGGSATGGDVEELQRLDDKLKTLRSDLALLAKKHEQLAQDLVCGQQKAQSELEANLFQAMADLKSTHELEMAKTKRRQFNEIKAIKTVQAKESAMEENVRNAERNMILERKGLNSLLESSVDSIITISPQGIMLRFNAAAEKMFGYSVNEVIGKNVKMLMPESFAVRHDQFLTNYLTTGVKRIIGIGRAGQGKRKDGSLFPIRLSISEVLQDDIHIFTGIIRDLTQEQAVEEAARKELEKKEFQMRMLIEQLDNEKSKSADLIQSMIPEAIAKRLLNGEEVQPEEFPQASVLFTEVTNFARLTAQYPALDILDFLDDLYCAFDEMISGYNVYKVETIGDCYLVVSGLPLADPEHAGEVAKLALHFLKAIQHLKLRNYPDIEIGLKIGIHSGPVVAGIIGKKTPRYCLFGDTVNTASRMKSTSENMRVQISEATYDQLEALGGFNMSPRGEVSVKGKGNMVTYWLESKDNFDPNVNNVKQIAESGRRLSQSSTSFDQLQ